MESNEGIIYYLGLLFSISFLNIRMRRQREKEEERDVWPGGNHVIELFQPCFLFLSIFLSISPLSFHSFYLETVSKDAVCISITILIYDFIHFDENQEGK